MKQKFSDRFLPRKVPKQELKVKKIYGEVRDMFTNFCEELNNDKLNLMQLFFAFETKHRKDIYDKYGKDGYGVLEYMKEQLKQSGNGKA